MGGGDCSITLAIRHAGAARGGEPGRLQGRGRDAELGHADVAGGGGALAHDARHIVFFVFPAHTWGGCGNSLEGNQMVNVHVTRYAVARSRERVGCAATHGRRAA
jgi:hypothetical protein